MFRQPMWLVAGAVVIALTALIFQIARDKGRAESVPTDPKEKELASLPVGLEVTHSPNPVKARVATSGRSNYKWVYKTAVKSAGGTVTVQEFGAFAWVSGRWVFSTFTGKPFTGMDFADWYSCPGARMEPGGEYADPSNWSAANVVKADKTKWYYIALNEQGERVKGEAIVEQLPEVEQ